MCRICNFVSVNVFLPSIRAEFPAKFWSRRKSGSEIVFCFFFFLPDYSSVSADYVAASFFPIGFVKKKEKLPVDWYGGKNWLTNGKRQVQRPTLLWGNKKKTTNDQALLLAGSLSWANTTSKDALRTKLNKNPVEDTRVAVSGSKWTHHIICLGH